MCCANPGGASADTGKPSDPTPSLCDLQVVAAVLFGGRAGRLDGGEGFEDPVRVRRAPGNRPGIPGVERYHRPLQVQLGATPDDVPHGLVLARDLGLGLAGLLVLP